MKKCLEYPNKNRYNTKKDAETAILLQLDNRNLNVYHCDTCEGWHLTSRKNKN